MTQMLVAVDGSEFGLAAARAAISLARCCAGANLTLAHVVTLRSGQIGTEGYPDRPDIPERWPVFAEPLRIAREAAVRAECRILFGNPAEQLLRYARRERVGLIILGNLGETAIKEFFLGSVASRVVSNAPCSVWVVRPGLELALGRSS
jgi:nucleotide-binding universal stress UspA family protein